MKRPWLMPLVPLYAAGVWLRSAGLRLGLEEVQRLAWPVIGVGSLSAGGAGKTPFAIALAQLLRREGMRVDVLSRGYGRVASGPVQVQPDGDAAVYGDEPLLIAKEARIPVYVDKRRYAAGTLAESPGSGTGVHLLDDGFQHRQLARDADIVLVSSEDLRDWLLPAGNLREPVSSLRRANALAVPAGDEEAVSQLQRLGFGPALGQPLWRFRREMSVPEIAGPVVAFCGIARPEQFFAGLESAGVPVAARHAFPDHHRFGPQDIAMLARMAARASAQAFVTTGKDRMRLGGFAERLEQTAPLHLAGLRVELDEEASAAKWISAWIQAAKAAL